jgi:5'-3' exonuclease
MGVKDFTKIFTASRTVALNDMKNMTLAIDAMTELYRAALGGKSVSMLTDKYGNPTMHINSIFAQIIEFHRNGIKQIWVFDYDRSNDDSGDFHNPSKQLELEKRQKKREETKQRLSELGIKSTIDDTDDDEPQEEGEIDAPVAPGDDKDKLEKRIFSIGREQINDIKKILDFLNVKHVSAPKGFEGECLAAYLVKEGKADAVYSGDTDPIPFGSPVLYRKNTKDKLIYEYKIDDLLQLIADNNDNYENPDLEVLRKACVAAGCDFAAKTPAIGPKTLLKKLHTIELTEEQENAIEHFSKEPNRDSFVIQNNDKTQFESADIDGLTTWMVTERSFKRDRVVAWLNKSKVAAKVVKKRVKKVDEKEKEKEKEKELKPEQSKVKKASKKVESPRQPILKRGFKK